MNGVVIGLGVMGALHTKVYSQIEGVTLVAICDTDIDHCTKISEQYGCTPYTDVAEMIQKENIQVASLATPTKTHGELAKQLLESGIHVLIEKPITDSIEAANELIALAQEKRRHLIVGHIERFNPAVTQLKKRVDDGDLGEITSVLARRVGLFPNRIKDANVVVDLAVHDIDIMTYLLGHPPQRVVGHSGGAFASDRDDHASIFLDFGKQSGYIQANWITPVKIRTLSVTGTGGYAELNYIDQSLRLYKSNVDIQVDHQGQESIQLDVAEPIDIPIERQDPITEEIRHFIQVVEGNEQPLVSGQAGRASLEIALQAIHEMAQ